MAEVLFQYGPFTFQTFNLFLALGFFLGMAFLLRYLQRKKMSASFLANHFILFLLAGLLGGRLLEGIEKYSFYFSYPLQFLKIWDFHFSPFGMLFGLLFAFAWSAHRSHENFWAWVDGFSLSGLVGLFFIHLGHFFNGSRFGSPTELPWGITFDSINIPFTNPLHPTQLYSALATFVVFVIAMKLQRHTHLNGMVGNGIIMLYSLSALLIDFFRGEPVFFDKIMHGLLAASAFIFFIHCSHQSYFKNPTP